MSNTPWRRDEDWNDIIRRINELCANPEGEDCTAIDPLNEVDPDHIWTVTDIQDVQDKLRELCSDNTFSVELIQWKQEIIDEIEAAILLGWCNCGCKCGWVPQASMTLFTAPGAIQVIWHCWDCTTAWPCAAAPTMCPDPPAGGSYISIRSLVEGSQLGGVSCKVGRWSVRGVRMLNGNVVGSWAVASGDIDETGVAVWTSGTESVAATTNDGIDYTRVTCVCTHNSPLWPGWCCDTYELVTETSRLTEPVGYSTNYILYFTWCDPDRDP
jgi:hypothetical protein